MASNTNILVTGAAGWTAQSIISALTSQGYSVVGFDLPSAEYLPTIRRMLASVYVGDIADAGAIETCIKSLRPEAIIHLAVAVGAQDYDEPERPFATNVRGTYNIFESAKQLGVRKIIMMSSAAVHLPAPGGGIEDAHHQLRTSAGGDHLYDLTKQLQEAIAQDYAANFEMAVVALRAGHIVDGRAARDPRGRPLQEVQYCRGGWVCRHDLAQACILALEHAPAGFRAYHVIGSREALHRFDVKRTEHELGLKFNQRFSEFPRA
jgi:nucleoside-diphosphate-sugar epimerase